MERAGLLLLGLWALPLKVVSGWVIEVTVLDPVRTWFLHDNLIDDGMCEMVQTCYQGTAPWTPIYY